MSQIDGEIRPHSSQKSQIDGKIRPHSSQKSQINGETCPQGPIFFLQISLT